MQYPNQNVHVGMKDIRFVGRSLELLRGFSAVAKREAGYQLDRVRAYRLETNALDRIRRPRDPNHARGEVSGDLRGEVCGCRLRLACLPEENSENEETRYQCSEAGAEAVSE